MNIVLGSAQFGLDYGISNTKGISSEDEVVKILQYANSAGIDTIDSASQYGKSESVIGRCVDQNSNWNIITKTPSFKGGSINTSDATHLSDKFKLSLENLNLKKNYGLLIHSCDDLFKPGGDLLFREMEKLKSKGLVSNIGVSLYTSNQIDNILDRYNVDIIQLPINILDQNLYTNGWLKKIKNSNVEIHARSVFLQGLLIMPESAIPDYFLPIKSQLDKFRKLSKSLHLSQLELALSYISSIDEIDSVVVGVNTVEQLKGIVNSKLLNINMNLFDNTSVKNSYFTNPSNWKV